MNDKKVLLIGGAGFIGSYLAKALVSLGYEVSIFDAFLSFASPRDEYKVLVKERMKAIKNKVKIYRVDIRKKNKLEDMMARVSPQYIIDLAAVSITSPEFTKVYHDDIYSTNVEGTLNILDSLSKVNTVKKFIFVSSSFVYGDFQHFPADERHPLNPINLYGHTKLVGEKLTAFYCKEMKMVYVIIRFSSVYGFGDSNKRISQIMIRNALEKKPIVLRNKGNNKLDFTYVEDAVAGLILALRSNNSRNEIFNITYGKGRSLKDYIRIMSQYIADIKVIERKQKIRYPKRGALSIQKARSLLKYVPKYPLESGIRRYISDMKQFLGL